MEDRKWYASRKFWMALGAALASVATSIHGFSSGNETVAMVGIICATASAAIYAAVEAYTDGQSLKANATVTTKTVTATASDKATVQAVMGTEPKEATNA